MHLGPKKQLRRIKFVRNLGSYLDNRLEIDNFVSTNLQ